MVIQYSNRVGKTYYLKEGKTKTGKPRYFFSLQQDGKGDPVDKLPEDYEIYEHPVNAQVFLRKKQPRLITDLEEQLVKKHLNALKSTKRYRIDCKNEYLTIYESNADSQNIKSIFGSLLSNIQNQSNINSDDSITKLINIADRHYTAILRFALVDKEKRKFTAERYCFRGSIDDWIHLSGPDHFTSIAKKYINLIGTDKFFDLPYL